MCMTDKREILNVIKTRCFKTSEKMCRAPFTIDSGGRIFIQVLNIF